MKRIILALSACLAFALSGVAQQSPADTPATKEDVQRFFEVMHSREMTMHKMMHEQYLKDKDKLPPDFEERMNKMMDDSMKAFPWDEMLQTMVPVYQKHLTRGDVDALVAFYSSPTGKKMLRDMPAIMGEAMESMMPLMQKQMDAMAERVQREVAQMIKDSESKSPMKKQATPN